MEHENETWIELTATVRNVIAFLIGKTDRAENQKGAAFEISTSPDDETSTRPALGEYVGRTK